MRAILGLAALLCCTRAAHAGAQASSVLLREQPCEPTRYDPAELRPLLAVELKSLGLQLALWPDGDEQAQAAAVQAALVVATLRCADTPDAVELELSDMASQTRSTRVLALSDVPQPARARALSLALVASLEQSLREALREPTPASPAALPPAVAEALRVRMQRQLAPPQPRPPPSPPQAVPAAAPGDVELSALTRVYPSYSTGMIGVHAALRFELGAVSQLVADADALAGQSELSDPMGTVGKMWLFALGGGLGVDLRSTTLPELTLGPRVRLGYARAEADVEREGATARDDDSAVLALLLAATVRAPIGRDASLLVGVDLGYAPVGIVFTGDQARLSGLAGITTALRLGCAL